MLRVSGMRIPVALFTVATIALLTLAWNAVSYRVSSLYVVAFFVAGRQRTISSAEVWIYVIGPNSVWVILPLLGLYVAVRLILDGNYAVLGR